MKRVLVLFVAAMLCSAPCFAAGSAYQHSHSSGGNSKGGEQTNVINYTDVKDTNAIAVDGGRVGMGNVENDGGRQTNVINETKLSNVNAIAVGKESEVKIGTVSNK